MSVPPVTNPGDLFEKGIQIANTGDFEGALTYVNQHYSTADPQDAIKRERILSEFVTARYNDGQFDRMISALQLMELYPGERTNQHSETIRYLQLCAKRDKNDKVTELFKRKGYKPAEVL